MTHVGQEHCLVLVRLAQRAVGRLQLDDEVAAVERGDERAHQLLHPIHLVAAEAGRERPREHDQRPRRGQPGHRHREHRLRHPADLDLVDAPLHAPEPAGDLRHLLAADSADGGRRTLAVVQHGAGATHQARRQLEGAARERVAVVAHQQLLHERAQVRLLLRAPLSPQPGRRREAGVEEGHDRQSDELDENLHDGLADQQADRDGDEQDREQPPETEAQRAQAPRLDRGQFARHQPEPGDGLGDARAPHGEPGERDREQPRPGRGGGHGGDEKDAGSRQRRERDGMPARREGDKGHPIAK